MQQCQEEGLKEGVRQEGRTRAELTVVAVKWLLEDETVSL